jgi:DinB superfamily
MQDLRYPIGPLVYRESLSPEERRTAIAAIAATPERLRAAVAGLSDPQLDTRYRPGGWTVRQVVHHLPDSHMNGYTRFKLALTEEEPTVRPLLEGSWGELPDGRTAPVELSLGLLERLHERWVLVLDAISPEQWKRTYVHPESGTHTLDGLLSVYSWHGPHHVAHITSLRQREGW